MNIFVVIGIIGNGNLPLEAIDPSHPLWMEGSPWLWTAGVRIPDCTMAPTSKQSLGYQLVAMEGWLKAFLMVLTTDHIVHKFNN